MKTTPNRDGCHETCTDGWIRHRGTWHKCPNHLRRSWDIGPRPDPVKTTRALDLIAEAKATAAAAASQGRNDATAPEKAQ